MHASLPTIPILLALAASAAAQGSALRVPPPNSPFILQYVQLQPGSPGAVQGGNINVTGAVIGGSFAGNGAALSSLNASSVSSGTLNDNRLSTNIARLATAQTFSGIKTFSSSAVFSAIGAPFSVANSTKVIDLNCDLLDGLDSSAFLQSIPVPLVLVSGAGNTITGSCSLDYYAGVYGESTATLGVGVAGYSPVGNGMAGYANTGAGVYGTVTTAGAGVWGDSSGGDGVYGVTYGGGHGVRGNSYTTDSGVYGENNYGGPGVEGVASGGGNGVTGRADYPYQVCAGVYGEHTGGMYGIAGRSTTGTIFGNDIGVWGETGGSSGWAMFASGRMFVNGDLYVAGSKVGCVTDIVKNGGGEPLEIGDLVEIQGADDAVLGELPVIVVRKATSANATAVLGPISTAMSVGENRMKPPPASDPKLENLGPALPRFQLTSAEGAIAPGGFGQVVTLGSYKALKVDASFGGVRPGDLLVASPNPGYAMLARDPSVGTVIGKSLGSLAGGTGTVAVLVNQQ
ncbi:MAG TPA: hypothetical protein VK843_22000 [Planctomycetota bacterium]|nr:hypothetical protein [Planctomycetota bacterium]